ncbi:MAG TPA: hypothetical protein VN816_01575 [Acidimicrobiales bacterium]|nr:hypothetical protein [Acidimicrobiales bacterium]
MNDHSTTTARDPSGGTCVFVVGMHRSGTSAVAGMLAQLGIRGPSDEDLIPATSSNQHGHFESKTLTRVDNQLLHILGGTWSAPPSLEPGWEWGREITAVQGSAHQAFHSTFPARPMVWKDPRNCIVLPFWRSVLAPPFAAVFVYRDGLEVAHSLQARDHLTLTHGLALWERYLRSACAGLDGVPTFVAEYGRLLEDPVSTCRSLVGFLSDVGIDVDRARARTAVDSLDAGLRHRGTPSHEQAGITANQRDLLALMHPLAGPHHPWRSPDLGREAPWVEDFLSLRRDYEVLNRQIRSSRAMRLVETWWKVRGIRRSSPAGDGGDA